jgi:DNA modification methylase
MFYVLSRPGADIFFKNQDRPGGLNKGMSDVWSYPRPPRNGHNAPFNQDLIEQVIRLWSRPGDLVCDPYSGSGTVVRAAVSTGRKFVGSERLKKYYDQSVESFEKDFIENIDKIAA